MAPKLKKKPLRLLYLLAAASSPRSAPASGPASPVGVFRRRRRPNGDVLSRPAFALRTELGSAPLSTRGGGDRSRSAGDGGPSKPSLPPLAFASLFGFLGGCSHVICNRYFDVYTSLLTGHYLNLSTLAAEGNWRKAAWRASILGSYVGGTALARAVEVRCERSAEGGADAATKNGHFKLLAPMALASLAIADRLADAKVALLAFGYGLIYPSVTFALGGTILHLMTGHTNNVSRQLGGSLAGKPMNRGATKASLCTLASVFSGAVFGVKLMGMLGKEFPYFTVLGLIYATAMLLLP
ncbi:hypothetical protein ACHAWF_015326 [Thalassiosira exigua]